MNHTAKSSTRTSDPAADRMLVVAAKNGDEKAFEDLFKRHHRKIFALAFRYTRIREDAEDIVQQTFQQAFVYLQKFEGKSSFATWVARVAISPGNTLPKGCDGVPVYRVDCTTRMLALYLGALWLLFGLPAQRNSPAKPLVRSCPDYWADAAFAGKKKATGKKKDIPRESGACIELAFSPLDIQEYLQSYARNERWILSADQLTEESWTFSLEIDKEALLRNTVAESSPKGIQWIHGSIRVHINTLQLPDGYARTTVHCIIRGYGRNTDQFAVQKEYWELQSSNAFENSVVSALRGHFSETSPDKATGKSGSE